MPEILSLKYRRLSIKKKLLPFSLVWPFVASPTSLHSLCLVKTKLCCCTLSNFLVEDSFLGLKNFHRKETIVVQCALFFLLLFS
jgi:hypothetical protein